jgi:uncharacterized SAM-binding protein YcdF (DUF218 family)
MARWSTIAGRATATVLLLLVAAWVVLLFAVVHVGREDSAQPATAIVVMGAAQYGGHPSPVLRARLDHAIALWHQHLAPWLIVTGGVGAGDTTSEGAVSRRYVRQHGVPDSVILVEGRGRTTSESLHGVASLLPPAAPATVILVSDPFHMLRLSLLARRLGMTPYVSPTRTSPISANREQRWRYVVAESVKVPAAYLLEHGAR